MTNKPKGLNSRKTIIGFIGVKMPLDADLPKLENIAKAYSSGMYQKPAYVEVLPQKQVEEKSLVQKIIDFVKSGEGVAYGAKFHPKHGLIYTDIEEYYKIGEPSDDIIRNSRVVDNNIKYKFEKVLSLDNEEWFDYYDGSNSHLGLKNILAQQDSIIINGKTSYFDMIGFERFIEDYRDKIEKIFFDKRGFMIIRLLSPRVNYITPVDPKIRKKIKDL